MYADKPMQGHGLMQAIARVNRVFKNKPGGLVVGSLLAMQSADPEVTRLLEELKRLKVLVLNGNKATYSVEKK